jgi:hypothetical protein
MKVLGFAVLVLSLTVPREAAAQAASGIYHFLLEDEQVKYVEFEATTETGYMTFTDQALISDDEVTSELYIKAELDDLTVEKNRAVMNGTILDSSHKSYVGTWVQLVVEDNGRDDPERPDRLTWAFCRPREGGWIPSDAERKDDDGAYLRWWATDAERDDDVGVPSPDLLSNDEKGCRIDPLWSYSFAHVLKWKGDIVVEP